jgi:hypothetical protein
MKRCKSCRTPDSFGSRVIWTKGGTIVAEKVPALRLFFIEIDELLNLLSFLSELLGVPIDNILIASERPIGRELVESIFSPAMVKMTRSIPNALHFRIFANAIFKRIAEYARAMGYGSITLIDYEGRQRTLVRARNPHSLPLIIGDCVGAFQVMLGVNMAATWKKENGTTLIEFRQTEEQPHNIPINRVNFISGEVDFPRCPTCGVPQPVSESFEWDMLNGIITNRRTAYREAFLSVEGINAIFDEMEKELGEEVPLMVAKRQAELMRERMSKRDLEEEGGILGLFEELKLRGMGNPVEVEEIGRQLKVKVENPFNDALVAGRIAGYYESVENVKSRVTWVSSEEGYLVIGVEPAQ